MAILDPRKALEHEQISQFGGIKSNARLTSSGCSDMRNFRILADGSLEKRCGFRKWLSFSDTIRSVWEGEIEGVSCFFAVAGSTVYRIRAGDTEPVAAHILPTDHGPVSFVFYCGQLYMTDGTSMVRYLAGPGVFTVSHGYTPLYGYNWSPSQMGAVHEPLNLFQNRIRIHYLNTSQETVFRLPYSAKQINHVTLDGVPTLNYVLQTATQSVRISAAATAGVVEIGYTLADQFNRQPQLLKAVRAICYTDPHHETFLCCGGSPGYSVYRSAPVSAQMLSASRSFYSDSDPLYFPENGVFTVGSVQHPITAICQSREQVLVMNDRTVWGIRHTDPERSDMRIYLLRTDVGCSSPGGIATDGGDVITVCENGIYRLTFPSADPDRCISECLSKDITSALSHAFLHRAIPVLNRSTGELWLADSSDESGTVWVWNADRKAWVTYDGIVATVLFERLGCVHFGTAAGGLYCMDESLDTDDDAPIRAYYTSHYLPFDVPAFSKRGLRTSLVADTRGGGLLLRLESERGNFEKSLFSSADSVPTFFDMRTALGRFRFLRFCIATTGTERLRIHSLSIAANN